jgi:putative ABC transport system permease protein
MNLFEGLRLSLRSLLANKLRSALTVLGIIIGVAAVISMLSIGRGAQASIENQITSMGSNLLYVRPGNINQGGVNQGFGSAATLTLDDATALADPSQVPDAVAVAPENDSGGQIVYLANNTRTRIVGTTPEYLDVHNTEVADGQFFSSFHVAGRSAVVVLGSSTAETLFAGEEPVGKTVRIMNQPFIVLGVLKSQGGTGFMNQDDMAMVPLTTLQQRLSRGGPAFRGSQGIGSITIKASSKQAIDAVTAEVQQVLRERHRILYDDDFTVQSQQQILDAAAQATNVFTIFLGGIAAISLLVGGIGIMNIMLVSVSERTREIGIRKAVGARRRDIQIQFLVEAIALSLMGGVLGILVGMGLARIVGQVRISGGQPLNTVVGLDSVLLATIFSVAVGVFFGLYPAHRAASLNPIDALRYE